MIDCLYNCLSETTTAWLSLVCQKVKVRVTVIQKQVWFMTQAWFYPPHTHIHTHSPSPPVAGPAGSSAGKAQRTGSSSSHPRLPLGPFQGATTGPSRHGRIQRFCPKTKPKKSPERVRHDWVAVRKWRRYQWSFFSKINWAATGIYLSHRSFWVAFGAWCSFCSLSRLCLQHSPPPPTEQSA